MRRSHPVRNRYLTFLIDPNISNPLVPTGTKIKVQKHLVCLLLAALLLLLPLLLAQGRRGATCCCCWHACCRRV